MFGDLEPGWWLHGCAASNSDALSPNRRYAGSGKALGDMWALQIGDASQPYSWTELQLSGLPPAPRYDHVAALFPTSPNSQQPDKLIIVGGRDSAQRFKDVHVLDLRSKAWDAQHNIPPLSHQVGW